MTAIYETIVDPATPASNVTTIEFGCHSMNVFHDARAVEIYSDSAASDRVAQRDWKAVCRQLRTLGVSGLDEFGTDRGDILFVGTF